MLSLSERAQTVPGFPDIFLYVREARHTASPLGKKRRWRKQGDQGKNEFFHFCSLSHIVNGLRKTEKRQASTASGGSISRNVKRSM